MSPFRCFLCFWHFFSVGNSILSGKYPCLLHGQGIVYLWWLQQISYQFPFFIYTQYLPAFIIWGKLHISSPNIFALSFEGGFRDSILWCHTAHTFCAIVIKYFSNCLDPYCLSCQNYNSFCNFAPTLHKDLQSFYIVCQKCCSLHRYVTFMHYQSLKVFQKGQKVRQIFIT